MADFAAQAPPTSVTKSPAPSVGADSPYHSIVQDAQSGLMEKVQADVGHVVHALEAIWNEVGYSGEERRLQMDKLSDELTQTLRAKLAQEVEVRDVFKKDIQAKIAECEMLARSVDDDGTGSLPEGLDVSRLRLSHGLMKLEEEQAKLEAAAMVDVVLDCVYLWTLLCTSSTGDVSNALPLDPWAYLSCFWPIAHAFSAGRAIQAAVMRRMQEKQALVAGRSISEMDVRSTRLPRWAAPANRRRQWRDERMDAGTQLRQCAQPRAPPRSTAGTAARAPV